MHEFESANDFDPWQKIQMMLGIGGRSNMEKSESIMKEAQKDQDFVKALKVPGLPDFQNVPGLPGFVCKNPYIPENGMCVHRTSPLVATPTGVPSTTPQCPPGSKLINEKCYDERVNPNKLVQPPEPQWDKCALKFGKRCVGGLNYSKCPDGYTYQNNMCNANVILK